MTTSRSENLAVIHLCMFCCLEINLKTLSLISINRGVLAAIDVISDSLLAGV